jgi:uncharacterized protein (TIGR03437 family)
MRYENRILSVTLLFLLSTSLSRAQGTITTIAGTGDQGFSGDGGPATAAPLGNPTGVAVDQAGNVYISDLLNFRVRKVDPSGTIRTVAGCTITEISCITGGFGDGGPATSAPAFPFDVAVDAAGDLYIVDSGNDRIRKVNSAGILSTVAGCERGGQVSPACTGGLGDGGPALGATFNAIHQIAFDAQGNLYIADVVNHRVRKVTAATGIITTLAGNGVGAFSGDGGPATSASLFRPFGVAVDAAGNVYIGDGNNNRIRRVRPDGVINTVAGNGSVSTTANDGPALSANLVVPKGLAFDGAGNLYIAETLGNRIRKLTPAGIMSTVAGTGQNGSSGDGGPSTSATLFGPDSLAIDSVGNIYVADTLNNKIRRIAAPPGPTPQITVPGITNGASFVSGSLVRGSIASIFGVNMTVTAGLTQATALPLPRTLAGTQVLINSLPAPLFAVASFAGQHQANFQVPWVLGGTSVQLQVVNNGTISPAITVPLLGAQPGIFAYSAGGSTFGAVLHADFGLADVARPAASGETVLIYCTGLGPVIPIPADGVAAAGSQAFVLPTVTIGGITASIQYAGTAPGYVGLNQLNVVVPGGLGSGNHAVAITANGVTSNAPLLPVR